jgi:hypothetical protein
MSSQLKPKHFSPFPQRLHPGAAATDEILLWLARVYDKAIQLDIVGEWVNVRNNLQDGRCGQVAGSAGDRAWCCFADGQRDAAWRIVERERQLGRLLKRVVEPLRALSQELADVAGERATAVDDERSGANMPVNSGDPLFDNVPIPPSEIELKYGIPENRRRAFQKALERFRQRNPKSPAVTQWETTARNREQYYFVPSLIAAVISRYRTV